MINGNDIEQIVKNYTIPAYIMDKIRSDINVSFDKGVMEIEKIINQNIVDINPEVLNFIHRYNFNLIKNINDDLAGKLRSTLERGILSGSSSTQISKDVKNIFKTSIDRAKMIARTETARAMNLGMYSAAKVSNVKLKKYWSAVMDNRTCPVCKRLHNKYNKDNPIPIDANFKDEQSGFSSPIGGNVHPNCRCEAIYIPVIK